VAERSGDTALGTLVDIAKAAWRSASRRSPENFVRDFPPRNKINVVMAVHE